MSKFKLNWNPLSRSKSTPEPIPQDVVVSFPKSGRTWLRVMLDRLGIELAYTHDGSAHNEKRHLNDLDWDKSPYRDSNVVLLVRDPRDVVVSGFFQTTKRTGAFNGTMSDFVKDVHHGIAKTVTFMQTWEKNLSVPKKLLLISYEEMHEDTVAVLRKVADFYGYTELPTSKIQETVDYARFENMQRMERNRVLEKDYGGKLRPRDLNDISTYKTRKGKVGDYVNAMSAEDVQFCDQVMEEMNCPFYPVRSKK